MIYTTKKLCLKMAMCMVACTLLFSAAIAQTKPNFGNIKKPNPNAVMDLSSTQQGFLLPRLTKAEIAALQTKLSSDVTSKGMIVYNSDDSCIQTWKGTGWSECDAISLAKLTADCTSSGVTGNFYTGIPVTLDEMYNLNATVVKPGTYSFYTATINGVRFYATGIVTNATGSTIQLQILAAGIPTAAGTFTYQLYDQSGKPICNPFNITVSENNAVFTVTCANTQIVGTFTEGQQASQLLNGINLQLDVSSSGYYNLHTDTVNGMYFSGTGYTVTGSASRVILPAYGRPTWGTGASAGEPVFTLYDKDNNPVGCQIKVPLVSTQASYTADCTAGGVVVYGVLIETKPVSSSNYITVSLNVTKPGPWKITTDTIKGVYFNGNGEFDAVGLQTITLYSNGTAVSGSQGLYSFKLMDVTNKNTVLCTPAAQIKIDANQADMTCPASNPVIPSTLRMNTQVAAGTVIQIPFDFTAAGPYYITASGSGLTFTASGTLASAGLGQNIPFNVSGKPTQADNIDGVEFSFSAAGGVFSCTKNISIIPTKGSTKTTPAQSCKEAMTDNGGLGNAPNGEYWILPPSPYTGQAMKTLCDMSTANPLTMVWSYSEQTAVNSYMGAKGIPGNVYSLNVNTPINDQNYSTEKIVYENFRMSLTAMQAITQYNGTVTSNSNTTKSNYWKTRVVSKLSNAADLNDANALANYIIINPYSGYAFTGKNAQTDGSHYVVDGKLGGKSFALPNAGYSGTFNGGSASFRFYGSPMREAIYGYTGSPSGQPSYFGGFGSSSDGIDVSGHFLDCNNGQVTCGKANLVASPNNRVIQVFVY